MMQLQKLSMNILLSKSYVNKKTKCIITVVILVDKIVIYYYCSNKYKEKSDYYKLCGQAFWDFISGDSDLYKSIIEPLGHKAKEKNDIFLKSYSQK